MEEINTKTNEPLAIEMTPYDWESISNGIDKLLDLEARQDHKTLADTEFGTLERLLQKIER